MMMHGVKTLNLDTISLPEQLQSQKYIEGDQANNEMNRKDRQKTGIEK
jgi:hypothetical protein